MTNFTNAALKFIAGLFLIGFIITAIPQLFLFGLAIDFSGGFYNSTTSWYLVLPLAFIFGVIYLAYKSPKYLRKKRQDSIQRPVNQHIISSQTLKYIERKPGITYAELAQLLNTSEETIVSEVRGLLQQRLVTQKIDGSVARLFPVS